jgi:hypothetical protein
MATSTHHVLVALNLSTHVPDIVKQGHAIVAAMTGNASFPGPNPPLATVTAALNVLDTTETAALTKAKGTAEARNAALVTVKTLLRQEEAYVQQIADGSGDQAETIIASAGMAVRKVTPRQKQVFHAVQDVSGTVVLFGEVAEGASAYNWQMSTDGKTFTALPTTSKAKTAVTGLTAGTIYFFRHEPVLKKGVAAEWSQVISILVK